VYSLPGVRLVTWTIPDRLSSDHTDCHRLVLCPYARLGLPPLRGWEIGYVDHTGRRQLVNPTMSGAIRTTAASSAASACPTAE
jgi:hypothetical protein